MDSGYTDVVKMLNVVAHDFGGGDGFFGHGNVTGAGGNDGDGAFSVFLVIALEDDGTRQFAIFCLADFFSYGCELLFGGAGGQDVTAMLGQAGKNLRYLCRGLALAEYDFRHPRAQRAMVIELGESEVFKRQMAQAGHGLVGRELSAANLLEEFEDGIGGQRKLSVFSTQLSARDRLASGKGQRG